MNIHTFLPGHTLPNGTILPKQTHSSNIQEVITGNEDLNNCDGLWTQNAEFLLGVQTADCAPICFWDNEKHGIIHAGWRGCVNGIIENLLEIFADPHIWIGPLYPRFEIQKDDCYDVIFTKFGNQFFTEDNGLIMFEYKACLKALLPQAQLDDRSTFDDQNLASWRRDKNFKKGQNITVIGNF